MSNNGRELSAREKRAVEARTRSNPRVSQRAGSSTPAPEVGATATPKSRRPDLEQNIIVATKHHLGYELVACSQTRQLALLRRLMMITWEKNDLEKQVATLQEVMKTTNDKRCKIAETFAKYESKQKRLQHEVADLKNRLGLRDAGVQRAVEKTKRDMAIRYEDRIGQGEVPDLDTELVALKKQEASLLSATVEFAFHMGKLEDILKDPSAGATESRVVDAKANAVPASSSSGPSGDEDLWSSTTGGPP
ncbi:hypothetical protein AALP_AAs68745U000300 [Arabis alpina]|nr:hypothetical protein AALP_AAs68745U000300 [Arabis alpina]